MYHNFFIPAVVALTNYQSYRVFGRKNLHPQCESCKHFVVVV